MQGLSEAFSSFFSNPGAMKAIQGGTLAAGEAGNILEEKKRLDYQNFVMGLLKDPAKLAAMVAKVQQPLNRGLTQEVTNQVQGDLASRGLSQAPGIIATTESQALSPFYQQNQSTALNAVLQSLGLPAGTFGQPANLGPIMSLFSKPLPSTSGPAPTPGLTPPASSGGSSYVPPVSGPDDPSNWGYTP
jgi:hypothetical protein